MKMNFKMPLLPINIKQFDGESITLDAVKKFFEDNKDKEEVKTFLGELSAVSADKVKGFLETDEGKKILQPYLDRHFTKGLETWKANNLEKLIDEEVKKRNPGKTPEQIEIEKLRKQIEDAEKARKRESLVNKALKVADEKALPKGIIDFFIGEDEEKTLANLEALEKEYSAAVQKAVEAKFKESGRKIDAGAGGSGSGGTIDLGKMAAEVSLTK